MNVIEHLQLIRAHTNSIQEEFKDKVGGKNAEIRSMLWGILDEVLLIEQTIPIPGGDNGKRFSDDPKRWLVGQSLPS